MIHIYSVHKYIMYKEMSKKSEHFLQNQNMHKKAQILTQNWTFSNTKTKQWLTPSLP